MHGSSFFRSLIEFLFVNILDLLTALTAKKNIRVCANHEQFLGDVNFAISLKVYSKCQKIV